MIVTGITPDQFRDVIAKLNVVDYQHNLTAHIGREYSATRFSCRVIPEDSGTNWTSSNDGKMSAPGARRSWSGRRLKAACWHAYRDVILGIFHVNPDARVYTGMAKYVGLQGFLDAYPQTAHQNIGSMAQPAYMPDLCDCDHYGISTHEYGE